MGSPEEVYEEPATAYVADFLGVSNLMDGDAPTAGQGDGGRVHLGTFELQRRSAATSTPSGAVKLVIRPERVRLEEHGTTGPNRVPGMVERVLYVGSIMQVLVHLAHGETLQAWDAEPGRRPASGSRERR